MLHVDGLFCTHGWSNAGLVFFAVKIANAEYKVLSVFQVIVNVVDIHKLDSLSFLGPIARLEATIRIRPFPSIVV